MATDEERLDEVAAELGWTQLDADTVAGPLPSGLGTFRCITLKSSMGGCYWGVSAGWGSRLTRRALKEARNRKDEILATYMTPELRKVLEKHIPVADREKDIGNSLTPLRDGLSFQSRGKLDPPPADDVTALIRHLAELAGRFKASR